MNLTHIITELQEEKEKLDRAILALERLSSGQKPRGRPRLHAQSAAKANASSTQPEEDAQSGNVDTAARGHSA